MPRSSPYVIILTAEERTLLEAAARRFTSPYRDVLRARIVLYAAAGLRNDEIAARLDTPRQIVSKWRKRFYEQRLAGLADFPGADGHRVFPPEVAVAIKALACELPAASGTPLARWHSDDLARAAVDQGIVASIFRGHRVAVAVRRRGQTLAAPVVDLPPRPRLCRQGRPRARPVPPPLEAPQARQTRLRHLRRREDLDPSAYPQTPHHPACGEANHACRARAHPRRRAGLAGRLGRPPRQGARTLRGDYRHRTVRSARGPGHGRRALRVGSPGVLDRGQRLVPPRTGLHRQTARTVGQPAADPPARPRILAQPGRDLLLRGPAQSVDPNDSADLDEVEVRLLAFQAYYEQIAAPFEWKLTRKDLNALLARTADQTFSSAA